MIVVKTALPMISNGKEIKQKVFNDKIITSMLSIATAGVIGCFGFLWRVNATLTRLEEHDTDNIKAREEWSIKTNNIQLDIRDIRDRVIKLESKNQR